MVEQLHFGISRSLLKLKIAHSILSLVSFHLSLQRAQKMRLFSANHQSLNLNQVRTQQPLPKMA
jgi:hypothetical protein